LSVHTPKTVVEFFRGKSARWLSSNLWTNSKLRFGKSGKNNNYQTQRLPGELYIRPNWRLSVSRIAGGMRSAVAVSPEFEAWKHFTSAVKLVSTNTCQKKCR
jgi:hypothetical protein